MIITNINNKVISYVGYTNNLDKRIKTHNNSKGAKFTRGKKWKCIYFKTFKTKNLAMKNEYLLKKNYKKSNALKLKYIDNENFTFTTL